MRSVEVWVHTADPLARAGILEHIETHQGIEVVGGDEPPEHCDVLLLAVDQVEHEVLSTMRVWAEAKRAPVVLMAKHLRGVDLMALVERHVMAVLPRAHVTAARLVHAVTTVAAGGAAMPSDLLGDLLRQMRRLHSEVLSPQGLGDSGLNTREVDVLRLVAEGLGTAEIAERLNYSERTVKLEMHRLTTRLKLRSRAHAVAYALRAGLL